ncbi:hypothetical protein ACFV29_03965 [Streptomyces sp. NPDC059690]|uniref:hypothetical protein n=1 Tax=Streptomyces sp. NPDC059690 TaxID=3346907 RepID=UPI0036B4F644
MSEGLTLDDLAMPLRALRMLAADFGNLPAPTVRVSPIWPDHLELSLHGDLAGFETWRDALDIAPDVVRYDTQGEGGRTCVLQAGIEYAGGELKLVGYGDVPAPVPVEAAG